MESVEYVHSSYEDQLRVEPELLDGNGRPEILELVSTESVKPALVPEITDKGGLEK